MQIRKSISIICNYLPLCDQSLVKLPEQNTTPGDENTKLTPPNLVQHAEIPRKTQFQLQYKLQW